MFTLQGYKVIEKISNNEEIAIYLVVRLTDQVELLAKTTNTHYVDAATVKLFQHEFEQFLALQGQGVIEPVSLEIVGERPILLFQNIEGFNLQKFYLTTKNDVPLKDKLKLAIALVECVQQLHNANIMMNEMIPLYFMVTENLAEVKLVDLRFAQAQDEVASYSISARKIDSLFAYVAPEKIEHTNSQYDYRADFYAMGVILYELFTGSLPYPSENILDRMYQHIAMVQKPAYLQNTALPIAVSSIIDKCMAKTPEARYASMTSLKVDLVECFKQFDVNADIQPFVLAKHEIDIAEKELVAADDSKEGWLWDMAALDHKDNKEQLFEAFLKSVDSATSKLLSNAAFLDSPFKLPILAEMTGYTSKQLQESLQVAINYQLIYNVSNEQQLYAFQHEEIQQVFYRQVEEQEQDILHMSAGRALAKYLGKDETITVTHVLRHFNVIKEYMVASGKQLELIQLNFKAAQQEDTQDEVSYYLQHAIVLLKEEHWQQHYEMTYNIYKLRAELAFLSDQYDMVRELCNILIAKSETAVDKVQAYILLMQLELTFDNYSEVLVLGEFALQLLQTPIELKIGKLKEWYYWLRIHRKLGKVPSKKILNLPQMQNAQSKTAARVLVYMANASLMSNREAWFTAVSKLLDLTFKYGVTSESSYAFASYSFIQCNLAFQYESAYHYSKFASNLVKDHPEMYMQVNTIITMCQDSWRRYEPDFLLAITDYTNQHGVLSNNKWQTNYNFLVNCALLLNFSYPLKDLYAHLLSRSSLFRGDYNTLLWKYAAALSRLLTTLTGYTAAHDPFVYERLEINKMDEENPQFHEFMSWSQHITAYLLGHYEEAYDAVVNNMMLERLRDNKGINNPSYNYFYVLIVKELFDDADASTQAQYIQQIRRSTKKLQRMAKRSPDNYLHKYLVAEAVYRKITKHPASKIEVMYEQAIQAAHQYGHLHDVGIISECFAKYHIQTGKLMQAKVYINEAYTAYQKWGALAKVAQLEEKYGNLLFVNKKTDLERVDYLTIVSSAQALSEEIEIEQLLHKLLRIMLQNAGAEYGALIFDNDGEWFVEAYGTVENLMIQSIQLDEVSDFVPTAIIDYTVRMKEEIVLHDAMNSGFGRNQYIQQHDVRSVLCLPIMYQNKLLSVLYMENNLSKGVFTEERLDVLKLLCSQCAISITNARLYSGIQYLTKNLEQQVEERTDSLQKSMQITSEALAEMTVYAERNRIAKEIHDIVGHTLTSTILQIEAGKRLLIKDKDSAVERLKDAQDLVRHSLSEIRNSVHMLKEDKYYDIKQALSTLMQDTERNMAVSIYAEIDTVDHLPVIMKKLIYHALQEGLTNGIRHGHSNEFHFHLKDNGSVVVFELTDNGIGAENLEMGFGLKMMRDRVRQLKGTFYVNTEQHKGCLVTITLPYSS